MIFLLEEYFCANKDCADCHQNGAAGQSWRSIVHLLVVAAAIVADSAGPDCVAPVVSDRRFFRESWIHFAVGARLPAHIRRVREVLREVWLILGELARELLRVVLILIAPLRWRNCNQPKENEEHQAIHFYGNNFFMFLLFELQLSTDRQNRTATFFLWILRDSWERWKPNENNKQNLFLIFMLHGVGRAL